MPTRAGVRAAGAKGSKAAARKAGTTRPSRMPEGAKQLELPQPAPKPSLERKPRREPTKGLEISVRTITPAEAEELAKKARPGTRVKESAVAGYERAMRSGEWVFNGMPIVIGASGQLLDGLHRLHACVRAGVPFETLVVENAPDDILHTLDQQRRRSFSGVLSARGVKHAAGVTTTLMRLIRYDEGKMRRSGLSVPWGRLERLYTANEADLLKAEEDSLASPAKLLSDSVRAPLIFMVRRARRARTIEQFLDAIANPKEHRRDEPGKMIWRRLEEQRGSPYRDPPEVTMAVCIKALNDMIKGTSSDYYRWIPRDTPGAGKRGEDFPKLWGYKGLVDPDMEDDEGSRRNPGARPPALRQVPTTATGVTWAVEQVEPEQARAWLSPEINKGNRNIVRDHVEAIARDIREGRWMVNVQPICFTADGRLLNGQHRLTAAVEAGEPIEVLVMRGVPEAAFATYDVQARRSPEIGDLLPPGARGALHFGDVNVLNAAATIMWREEVAPQLRAEKQGERQKSLRPTASEIRELILSNPGLLEQRGWARKVPTLLRTSWAVWLAYRVLRDDPKLGPVFLERLESGADLPAGHVILKLRRKLLGYREKRVSPVKARDAVLEAWEEFRRSPGLKAS